MAERLLEVRGLKVRFATEDGIVNAVVPVGTEIVVGGSFTRISDEDLQAAVDRMTRVALATVTH